MADDRDTNRNVLHGLLDAAGFKTLLASDGDEALNLLSLLPKAAAVPVRKTVQSAAANAIAAEGTAKVKTENLRIEKIFVDGGPIMKRIRAMEPRVRELARQQLMRFEAQGGGNFITDYAYLFPTLVMCDMLGMQDFLADIDFIRARALLAQRLEAVRPG